MTPSILQTQTAVPGPGPEARQAANDSMSLWQFAPLVIIGLLFYFVLLGPQRKQQKQREEMLNNIKKSDHVLTQGGIYGIVQRVDKTEVVLVIDEKKDVRIRVARSAIAGVEKVAAGEAAPQPSEARES